MSALVVTPHDALSRDEKFLGWLRQQGIEPTHTFRVEIKDSQMKVFQYVTDLDGVKITESEKLATLEPFTVEVSGPVPGMEVEV